MFVQALVLASLVPVPSGPNSVTRVSARQEAKSPVPADDKLEAVRKQIRAVYAEEYEAASESKSKRVELAKALLDRASGSAESVAPLGSDELFGVLVEAQGLAVASLDLELAFAAIDRLDSWYSPIDPFGLKSVAVLGVCSGEGVPADHAYLANQGVLVLEQALDRELADLAADLLKQLNRPIKRVDDPELDARRSACRDWLRELKKYYTAMAVLESKPLDPVANQTAGRYRALFRGHFERGLPMLALSPPGALATCAKLDVASPSNAKEQLDVAKAWQELAGHEAGQHRVRSKQRAVHWYELALKNLSPLEYGKYSGKLEALRKELEEEPAPVAEARPKKRQKARPIRGLTREQGEAIERGIDWLVTHQAPGGNWDCEDFGESCECVGAGSPLHTVGVTGLAVVALLQGGGSSKTGLVEQATRDGLDWLLDQQDPDSGLIGPKIGLHFLYNHAVAVMALANFLEQNPDSNVADALQSAVDYIAVSRNPYGAWRYDSPPVGDTDTSATSWMICALSAAERVGARTDPEANYGAISWFDEVTNSETGRTGYDLLDTGSARDRTPGGNAHFPTEGDESMTASALHCRYLIGQSADTTPVVILSAEILAAAAPELEADGLMHNLIYWYHGTEALYGYRISNKTMQKMWNSWSLSLRTALVNSQQDDGHSSGSWSPDGPWGYAGGRVYSTALAVLCLTRPSR